MSAVMLDADQIDAMLALAHHADGPSVAEDTKGRGSVLPDVALPPPRPDEGEMVGHNAAS